MLEIFIFTPYGRFWSLPSHSDWYNFKELKCKLVKVDIAQKQATLFLDNVDAADILLR